MHEKPVPFVSLVLLAFVCKDFAMDVEHKVIQKPPVINAIAGDNLRIQCSFPSFRKGFVKWTFQKRSGAVVEVKNAALEQDVTAGNASLSLNSLRVQDAGVYFCETGSGSFTSKGSGTSVIVTAKPSPPRISAYPSHRVEVGESVTLSCTSEGFYPQNIKVMWLKDGKQILNPQFTVHPPTESPSYMLMSMATIQLNKGDITSIVTCQVTHEALQTPLMEMYNLSNNIRVPPTLTWSPLCKVLVNESMQLACSVTGFYPQNISVTWLKNGMVINVSHGTPTKNSDGTYSLSSSLELIATELDNNAVFSCRVLHDSKSQSRTTTPKSSCGDGRFISLPNVIIRSVTGVLVFVMVVWFIVDHYYLSKEQDISAIKRWSEVEDIRKRDKPSER